jgi:hypothetical protein
MTTKTMEYEATPFKAGSLKTIKNKVSDGALDKVSTSWILWYLLRRHKFGLVSAWAIVITISWAFPPFWSIIGSLIGK